MKKIWVALCFIVLGTISSQNVYANEYDLITNDGNIIEYSQFEGIGDDADYSSPSEELLGRAIFGNDNRTLVTNTSQYPYSAIVYLLMEFPKGYSQGSGSLISNNVVLTAGHCLYSANLGGWAKSVTVIPGYNGSTKPFGTYYGEELYVTNGWYNQSNSGNYKSENDIGIIKLNSSTSAGYLGVTTGAHPQITLTGFHGDKSGKMYTQTDKVMTTTTEVYTYQLDTKGGSSGSPVYNNNTISAVNVSETENYYNTAARLTGAKWNLVYSFATDKRNVPTPNATRKHGIRTNWFTWNGNEIHQLRTFLQENNLSYTEFKDNGHIGIDVTWFNQNSPNKKKLTEYLENKKWHYELLVEGNGYPAPKFNVTSGELPFLVKKMHGIRTYWYHPNSNELSELRNYLKNNGFSYSEKTNNGYVSVDILWFNQNSPNKRKVTDYLENKKWHYTIILDY